MDIREQHQLTTDQEMRHWWIRTRFHYLDRAVKQSIGRSETRTISVLEVGCGTAQNLRYLRSLSSFGGQIERCIGVEPELVDDITMLSNKDRVVRDVSELTETGFDLLVVMDVIEHIEDERQALKNWLPLLKPGGLVFITVPAFQNLWSYHDEVLRHFRRYTRSSLVDVCTDVGLKTQATSYAFSHAFVPVWMVRKILPRQANGKSDLAMPNLLLNYLLTSLGRLEANLGGTPWFGTSVIGYFQKADS